MDWKDFGENSLNALTGAAIGTVGGLATAALNNKYQKQAEERANAEYDRRYAQMRSDALADYEREYANFLENREYNSVGAQYERLKAAGINPNVAAGGSFQSAGQSSASVRSSDGGSPYAGAAHLDTSLASSMSSSMMSGMLRSSELDLANDRFQVDKQVASATIRKIQTEAILNASRSKNVDLDSAIKRIEKSYRKDQLEAEIGKVNSEIEMNRARALESTTNSIVNSSLLQSRKDEIVARINNLNTQSNNLIEQAKLYAAQARYYDQEAITSSSRAYSYDSSARLNELKSEWQSFQNGLTSVYKSIEESNAKKAEKEAWWHGYRVFMESTGSLIGSIVGTAGYIFVNKGKGFSKPSSGASFTPYQGYSSYSNSSVIIN